MIRREDGESPEAAAAGADPVPVADLLDGVSGRRGWAARLHGARIHSQWSAIAGEQLARHVEPVRLVGGVLVVRATSSAWATQVGYLSGELAARANAVLGEGEVTRVTVTVAGPEQRRGKGI